MQSSRVGLLVLVGLLNLPWLLIEPIGMAARGLDLCLQGYDGCQCLQCRQANLTWSAPFWPERERATCGNGRQAEEGMRIIATMASIPCAAAALHRPNRTGTPTHCRCGYARAGLAESACCPECGTLPGRMTPE